MKKMLFAALAAFAISFAASSCGGSSEGDKAVKEAKELAEKIKAAKDSKDMGKLMEILNDAQKFAEKYKDVKLTSSQEKEIEEAMKALDDIK